MLSYLVSSLQFSEEGRIRRSIVGGSGVHVVC